MQSNMKKKNTYGFLDIYLKGKHPPWVRESEKWLRKNWGNPCSDYCPTCASCSIWVAWSVLHDNSEAKMDTIGHTK